VQPCDLVLCPIDLKTGCQVKRKLCNLLVISGISAGLFVFESVAGAGHAHKRTDDDAVLNAACSRDGDGGLITRVVRLNRSLMNCCSVFASIYSIS